ncbi:uncharacterized protein LOC144344498 [Saccoglossus kowalevskii]
MAKVDLKSAYLSVRIHRDDYQATGLKWQFFNHNNYTYTYDTRLPFGAKCSPYIFNAITQAAKRVMIQRGFNFIVVYLDDFLVISEDFYTCQLALNTLLSLLRQLGFSISWKKVEGPVQKITFLGIEIDSRMGTVALPRHKQIEFLQNLQEFSLKRRATKRQLQQLAGKLNWAAQVVHGGRTFLRRVLDAISKLKASNHKCRLNREFQGDIQWWLHFLSYFNHRSFWYHPIPETSMAMDASNMGAGVFYRGDWQYVN